ESAGRGEPPDIPGGFGTSPALWRRCREIGPRFIHFSDRPFWYCAKIKIESDSIPGSIFIVRSSGLRCVMLSRGKHLSVLVVLVITLVGLLGTTAPSHASASTINGFFADCERFSVDVTMQGITNDGGGFDKFRYMVVDGDGNTLYAEDSARQTCISDRSAILDLAYDENIGARPVQNPITFKVIDLDGNARPGAVLREATYNAACLSVSDSANAPDNFLSLVRTEGKLLENTTLYYAPGYQYPTGARAFKGDKLSIVYRSNDDQWIGALISPHDMIWVPAGAIDVALFGLPIQPTRIDPSQQ